MANSLFQIKEKKNKKGKTIHCPPPAKKVQIPEIDA